jgi:eukaryotic-like serine/threonine-protein kinase
VQERGTDSLTGAVIDQRYLIKSRLARGGMSTVYLATDQRLERDVALKVLYPHLAEDSSFLERFEREAKSAARLSHPHVVGVLDQGTDGSLAYLVMEYVPGRTLRALLDDQGPLSPRQALALLDPVIEGLAAAHAAGLIHRDVKPENVLLAADGRIKIADFGLARAVTANTSTATLVGTVAYIAPELVTDGAADARADIYSAGIMLYEMLTGRQPFSGEAPIQIAFQHVHSTVPAPSAVIPGLARDLDELVQWCTAQDPEERPVDGTALLGELRHIRTALSDAELDFDGGAVPAPGFTGAAATEVVRSPASRPQSTEVIRGADHPTAVIAAGHHPTQALPDLRQGGLGGAGDTGRAGGAGGGFSPGGGRQLSQRTQDRLARKDFKAYQKRQARAAQRPEHSLRRGNPRRRAALWIALFAVLAVLAAAGGWFFGSGPGAAVELPEVSNRPVAEAQAVLAGLGLSSRTEEAFDDNIGNGLVVRSEPEAPAMIRKFQPVVLVVSKGPELFEVPNLLQKDVGAATEDLREIRLTLGQVTEAYDETVAAGLIVAQEPRADDQVRRGTPVNLVVSLGPEPIDVPVVTGMSQDEAVQALADAGLRASIAPETVYDGDVPAGAVAAQRPDSGRLNRGDAVTLTISRGPRMVDVPSFIGQPVNQARRELERLGFRVEVDEILGGFFGTVRAQDPVDESVPEGSLITLTVV